MKKIEEKELGFKCFYFYNYFDTDFNDALLFVLVILFYTT